jgi:gluconate 2-dehydrogenase gamma chain
MSDSFFDAHQRATIESAMARIIPSDDAPGSREAGCVDFLDRYLSGLDYIFAKPDGSGFETLKGRTAVAWLRRIDALRRKYIEGIRDLDRRALERAGVAFADLSPDQQDETLREIESAANTPPRDGSDAQIGPASGQPALQQTSTEIELDFLHLVITHTRQGFYADPIYGGNRSRAGWKTIGFPGPASLKEVHEGRYTTLQYFAPGEVEKVREFHDGL